MNKPSLDTVRLHALVVDRWKALARSVAPESDRLTTAQPSFGVPHLHPRDALGRNWDIAQVRNVGAIGPARVVIDQLREAYDLDPGPGTGHAIAAGSATARPTAIAK